MKNLLVSCLLLIGLYVFYTSFVTHSHQTRIVSEIIQTFNFIIRKNVYSNFFQKYSGVTRVVPENDYCARSDFLKFFHPDMILNDIYTIRETNDLTHQILRKKTFDTSQQYKHKPDQNDNTVQTKKYYLLPQLSIYYPYYSTLGNQLSNGKQSLCMFQKYNHIPTKHQLSLKQKLMNNYYRQIDLMRSLNITQDCIDNATYIPETYRLYNKLECDQFFELVNTKEFQNITKNVAPQFITKLGNEVHRGRGINVLFTKELKSLSVIYDQGKQCGIDQTQLIAQRYISNPYLYKKHKIEFRIYWFLASTNPMIAYSYKRPLIKRCAKPFDLLSTEKAAHVCNTAIVKQNIQSQKKLIDNDKIEGEEFFIDWSFEGLQDKLFAEGKIKDTKWLKNTLYPLINKKLIHLVRSAQYKFQSDSRLGEFFATDFILSDDLEIFVLETNNNPQVLSVTPDRVKRNYKMIMDTIEIMNVYLRSRYLRIKQFIQELLKLHNKKQEKSLQKLLSNKNLQNQLVQIYKDKLDQGLSLSPNNLFHKFIDENNNNEAIYNGLVQQKCMFRINPRKFNKKHKFSVNRTSNSL